MERELAAFPHREMQGLERSCSWKMKHLCSVELPGRGTWPECGVWAIAALSISLVWLHALFCVRWIWYDLWQVAPLLPAWRSRPKPCSAAKNEGSCELKAGRSAPVNPLLPCWYQQPHRCDLLPFLADYGNSPASMSQPRTLGLTLELLSKPPKSWWLLC